jgi:histidine triad (HIT) family protein
VSAACIFCKLASGELEGNIVYRDATVAAFLDRAPLFLGHTLVVPRVHAATLDELAPALVGPLFDVVRRMSIAVQQALSAEGSFVAVNTRVSQSVPHLHVHVVPRREGDGFFSPRPIWRRRAYESEADAADHAARIKHAFEAIEP